MTQTLDRYAPTIFCLIRLIAGLLFMEHGLNKLIGFPVGGNGMPATLSFMWFSGVVEAVMGGLIAIGLMTRVAAFLASGQMSIAYFMVHAPKSFYPMFNGGDAAILFCFFFFYLVFAGGGVFSLDSLFARGSSGSVPAGAKLSA
jgi:putative oxidoreductase